jgi:hypothetical protein
VKYYASKKYKIACNEGRYHIKNIKPENLVVYESIKDVITDGCRLCKDCNKPNELGKYFVNEMIKQYDASKLK